MGNGDRRSSNKMRQRRSQAKRKARIARNKPGALKSKKPNKK